MPFRRRSPAGWAEKIRNAVWPRKGLTRNLRYYGLRAARISASPYAVAAGIAAGVMIGWTPFLGFHIPLAIALAFILRGSLVAAALGTLVANPLTFPLIWSASWEIGHYMLGHPGGETGQVAGKQVDLAELVRTLHFAELWQPVLKPMLIGCVPPALFCGLVVYAATYMGVRRFRARRRERMAARLHGIAKAGI
ncbi:uncharacterized protein (DUF2062 family) [Neorhizobium huautlense]|uniref:Uncharacterized protein (DUF2062 family) n=1 Tax=Neorhizobium huautlense TaxID=67774 RepID=A0ABT9PYJ0_9HYPH|nr:DUF2062 domain-containing protein [Neorhizobium huautlense]MDP9839181.1 uncharacterized protein (DUF2062 family) [Neorhizobium huautlense]